MAVLDRRHRVRHAVALAVLGLVVLAVGRPDGVSAQVNSASVLLNGEEFLPGQKLQLGYNVTSANPITFYLGIASQASSDYALFGQGGTLSIPPPLTPLPDLLSFGELPANATSTSVRAIEFYIPTNGLVNGDYSAFAAAVLRGSLQDNSLDSGDIVAAESRHFTVTYSSEPRFEFEATVSNDKRGVIQESVRLGAEFLNELGAPELGAVTIFAYDTLDGLGQAYAKWLRISPEQAIQLKGTLTGEASLGVIFLRLPNQEYYDGQAIFHELFHVLQSSLVGTVFGQGDFVSTAGPSWLIEGSAQYFQTIASVRAGIYDLASERNRNLARARNTAAPLSSLETFSGMQTAGVEAAYALGFFAVEFMLSTGPLSSLYSFWQLIGAGQPWPAAFSMAFGRSLDTFYQQFEAYRVTAIPHN